MFFNIFLISFLTWSMSNCEPPVNSYLPPSSGSSSPSSQYGPPGFGGRGPSSGPGRVSGQNQQSSFQNGGTSGTPNNQYVPPSSNLNQQLGSSTFGGSPQGGVGQNQQLSQPSSHFGASNQFGGSQGRPSERLTSGSPGSSSSNRNQRPETSYGPPPTGDFQTINGGSFDRSNNQQQVGNGDSNFNNSPIGSGPQRNSPSALYGAPGFGSNAGGPQSGQLRNQNGNFDGEGSNGPAKYEFSYQVDDEQTGTKFGHSEQRDGDLATGEYNVVLPDGRKQVVEYEAGLEGYKPQIRYEGSAGGQGGRQGFPQGGTNSFSGGNNDNAFGLQSSSPARYQEGSSLGSADASQGEGYPRGGPGGSSANGIGGNGFSSSNFGSSGSGSVNGRGGQSTSVSGTNGGYPSGGPQNGGPNNRAPQNSGSFTQNSSHSGGSNGYPNGGAQNSGGFSNGGEAGYPSGGPNGVRGSGY